MARQHGVFIPAILDDLRSDAANVSLTGSNRQARAALDNFSAPFGRDCLGCRDVASTLRNDVG